jgi:hypothetical protein
MIDLCPHRPPTCVRDDIWHNAPRVASAFLGYCEGRLGIPANPPCIGKAEYMQEYLIGSRRRATTGEESNAKAESASGEKP